ncbi:MAG: ArnT family glycosyltransferase [Acidobacteriota bacterium]
MSRTRVWLAPVLAPVVLTCLSLPWLTLPGPYEDEVLLSIPAVHLLTGKPPGPFGSYENWRIAGRYIAILNRDYLSYLKGYTLIPAFCLNGISVPSMRMTSVVIGVLALLAGYFFLRRLAGFLPAVLGTVLVATDASYIFHNRHDWGPVALMFLFKLGALYFFTSWWKTNRKSHFLLGSACLGLGMLDKANFAWFLFAAASSFVLTRGRQWRRWKIRYLAVLSAFLLLGSYFYINHNLFSKGQMLSMMRGSEQGWDKFAPAEIYRRAEYHLNLLQDTLAGRVFYYFTTSRQLETASWLPWLFWLSIPVWLVLPKRAPASFLLLLNLFTFVVIALTPAADGSHHTMAIYPFPQYFSALVLSQLYGSLAARGRRIGLSAAGLVAFTVAAVVASNLVAIKAHYDAYRAGLTNWAWSTDTYQLVDYLQRRNHPLVHALDWGIGHNVLLLGKGAIDVREPFWPAMFDLQFPARFEETFPEPDAVYVLHSEAATTMKAPRDWFLKLARSKVQAGLLRECEIGDRKIFLVFESLVRK